MVFKEGKSKFFQRNPTISKEIQNPVQEIPKNSKFFQENPNREDESEKHQWEPNSRRAQWGEAGLLRGGLAVTAAEAGFALRRAGL